MDEEHIILLLAVIAVLVLAVAVVILLPKEKVAAPASEEEEKQRRRRSNKKPRQSVQVGNVKAKGIKGFDEVEDAEDEEKLLQFIRGTSYELNTAASKKEQRKNKPEDEAEEQPEEEEDGEEFTKITKTQKKKSEGESHENKGKGGKGKRKKLFFKPEIIQEMREGRKKDREEKQKSHEGADQDKEAKPKKKKEQKTEEGASSSEDKKSEKKDTKPQNKDKGSDKETKEPKEGSSDQKRERKPRGPPRERDPNRPPRAPGLGRGTPRLPPPIRNTGLEPASLDDMLNAITNYYPANIFQQRFGDPKILIRIFSYLPFKAIKALTHVDRFFHSFIKREDNIWRDLCRRDFGLTSKLPAAKNFKQTYKLSYKGPK